MTLTREIEPPVGDLPVRPRGGRAVLRWFAVSLVVLAMLAYYFWTALLPHGRLLPIHGEETDHFNLLSRGFQKGHLYLDGEVPRAIVEAANPYDPKQRENVEVLHDASYYRGKYYIYFGPAPVVTLLLPFSLIAGRDLPLPYAVWFFSSVGYLALAGIFLFLQRRHHPGASLWTITASLIALGGASMLVALLRRGNIWEMSASSGFCYFALSMVFLIRALHSARATTWATLGGLALGLAVASRPTYIMCSALFVLPLLRGRGRWIGKGGYGWPAVFGAAASCGVIVLGLLAYNYARFENPLEFGITYQLSSANESENRHFSLSYVGFNFRVYFLAVLNWLPYFPFANGVTLPPFPPGHGGHEYTFGMIPNLPFTWFAAVLPVAFVAWRRNRAPGFWPSLGVITAAGLLNAAFLLCFFGCCIRYMVDFTPWFLLLACIGLVEAESHLRAGVGRNLLRTAGLALALWSSLVAALSIVNFYDPQRHFPLAYRPLARVLNLPSIWRSQQAWPGYGPVELSLSLPEDRRPRKEVLASLTREEKITAVVFIEHLDGDRFRLGYEEPASREPMVFSPAMSARRGVVHTLRLSIGGPYSESNGAKGRLRAHLDRVAFWDASLVSFTAYPGKLEVGPAAGPHPHAGTFTGRIHAERAVTGADRSPANGVRVRFTITPEMVGRSFPLITTGRTMAGDLLFVRVEPDGRIRFGYDHWAAPLLLSPEVSAAPGETCVINFWVPALDPEGRRLLVQVDGETVWQREAAAFPVAPGNVFLGANPIGGTTCEPVIENGMFDDVELAFP